MANTPLTLAALATSAVPGLQVSQARSHGGDGANQSVAAVIATNEGDLIVRVPTSVASEVRQSGELLGTAALADGSRQTLPFAVPETRGVVAAGETRAVVTTFLTGEHVRGETIEADALLLQSIAESISAIHGLPASLVLQAGLPVRSAEDIREQCDRLIARAAQTRLLPETVHLHWKGVLEAPALWDFAPTVTHGSLDVDQLLVSEDRVTGILGWAELSVGDPAFDLSWLLASGDDVLDAVLARYATVRSVTGLRELRARAVFHQQLAVAKWLLHGVEQHDQSIIDDAVEMFDRLVDRLSRSGATHEAPASLSADEVDRLLDEVPEVSVDPRSETAEHEALDEDREFLIESDFAEQVTQPIDPKDLPDAGR